jgi:hypothetical protein
MWMHQGGLQRRGQGRRVSGAVLGVGKRSKRHGSEGGGVLLASLVGEFAIRKKRSVYQS